MKVQLRPWRRGDETTLQSQANDALVSRWMLRRFPFPYTLDDAKSWIESCGKHEPAEHFAVEADGMVVGGAALQPRLDGTHDGVAIIGYWLGREYWRLGIATEIVKLLISLARASGLRRLQAGVFVPNIASARVLEKAGFCLEGQLRESYVERDGTPVDELIYGLLLDSRSDLAAAE